MFEHFWGLALKGLKSFYFKIEALLLLCDICIITWVSDYDNFSTKISLSNIGPFYSYTISCKLLPRGFKQICDLELQFCKTGLHHRYFRENSVKPLWSLTLHKRRVLKKKSIRLSRKEIEIIQDEVTKSEFFLKKVQCAQDEKWFRWCSTWIYPISTLALNGLHFEIKRFIAM